MGKRTGILAGAALLGAALLWPAQAACAGSIYDSPYVTWSPDGQAFTTNAGEKPAAQEPPGKRVATGAA
ncbi:MAG: hypothetical protein LBQ15_02370, partial [Clostridium sp.]|nr:hypothetical protein [Clostridium sp.]